MAPKLLLWCLAGRFIMAGLLVAELRFPAYRRALTWSITMLPNAERRQHPRSKPFPDQQDLTIIYQTESGPNPLAGKLIDFGDEGLDIEIESRLPEGATVEIVGEIEGASGRNGMRRRGTVCRCAALENGQFLAGFSFESIAEGSAPEEANGIGDSDHYELLQLSRNATVDTIQRVFRILAKRYHPDNKETGNPELFRHILEAARVLMDPQLRAAYDARLGAQDQSRLRLFEDWRATRGVEAEKRKRKGILALLYGRRMTEPEHPSLSLRDLQDMLDCPLEHLEFTIWFLKESKWIRMVENSRYEITLPGVQTVEAEKLYPWRPALPQLEAYNEEKSG
jgi:hypothetical protein